MEANRFPLVFRFLAATALFLFAYGPSLALGGERDPGNASWREDGIDRPGLDFKILWVRGGVDMCQEACAQNPLCKAYTYVRPGVPGRMEGCWLKDGVALPVKDDCCISGVKSTAVFTSILREEALPEGHADLVPPSSATPGASAEPPARISGLPLKETPRTGSASRGAEGVHYAAIPRAIAGTGWEGVPPVTVPNSPVTGTGRRKTVGVDFAAAPLAERGRGIAGAGLPGIPATGAGTRKAEALPFAATPPDEPGRKPGVSDTGTATREILGADFLAEPYKR